MTPIRPNLWLGGAPDAANHGLLRDRGVTAVLNVAYDCNDPWCHGIRWAKVGLYDDRTNPRWMLAVAIQTLAELACGGATVYVHCLFGQSRSPFVLGHFLAAAERRAFDEVWREMRSLRPKMLAQSRMHGSY